MTRIATWNVNSIKARLPLVLDWLKTSKPDIALLQETKVTNDNFPAMEIEELGYNLALNGQKTYNGVAILSKYPLDDIITVLPGEDGDDHARYIEAVATVGKETIRVVSVYVPNGQEVGSDKYAFKMRFYDRLYAHLKMLRHFDEMLVVGGDYNVAPEPIDVHDPEQWEGNILFSLSERRKLRSLLHLGLIDGFRALNPQKVQYSWWDYRANAWKANHGLRIDHLLVSPQAADRLSDCLTEESWRDGEKASDHAPVSCQLSV